MAIVSSSCSVLTSRASDDLTRPEALADVHRSRRVDDEREVGRRAVGVGQVGRADADPHEPGAVVGVRGVAGLDDDAEPAVGRCRVAVVEGVDPLLDADRRRVGERALVEERLADGPRAGVDVEAERRLGVVGGGHERGVAARRRTRCPRTVRAPAAARRRGHRDAARSWPCRRPCRRWASAPALVSISPSRYSVMYERASMSGSGGRAARRRAQAPAARTTSRSGGSSRMRMADRTAGAADVVPAGIKNSDHCCNWLRCTAAERSHRGTHTSHRHRHRGIAGTRPGARPGARRPGLERRHRRPGRRRARRRRRRARRPGRRRRRRHHRRRPPPGARAGRRRARRTDRPRRQQRRRARPVAAAGARPSTRSTRWPTCSPSTSSPRSG